MEPTTIKLAAEAAKELGIAELIPTVYEDLLQSAAQEVGQQLLLVAKAVGIALAPLKASVWGFDRIQDFLSARVTAKLAGKPATEIKSPDMVVAGPVVMGMAFAAQAPHLREMYANLLAAAMHGPSTDKAHPSFVQIIQQLSPAEARILEELAKRHDAGDTIFLESDPSDCGLFIQPPPPAPLLVQWGHFCKQCGVTNQTIASAYYNNLLRLGILAEHSRVGTEVFRGADPLITTKHVTITNYGKLFLDVCVRG